MTGLVIVVMVVGAMLGMGIERKHPTKPAAPIEQVQTINGEKQSDGVVK